MIKVSVIVPVYNVEKYLKKCLDSLAKQTLSEMEVIIVNDGSPDNSDKIIAEYTKKYHHFSSYKKKNGGLSSARNYGLKYAKGHYVAFLDSDDYVTYDMYEKMYEKAISNDFDMVVCDVNYVFPDKSWVASSNIKEDTTNIKKVMNNIYPAAWNKIFKRDLLIDNNLSFKESVWFEDIEFIYRVLPYIRSIGVIHQAFNQYVQRPGSITNTVNKKIYDYVYNMNSIIKFYKEKNLYDEYRKELEYSYVRHVYATFIKNTLKFDYKDYLESVDFAKESVKEYFPKYRRNSYFYKSLKGIYLVLFSKTLAKIMYKLRGKK